ncbi:MAG: histidine kinase [Proteobacteria bacterium]|nr:histidine kinase [Pseudomonadota bacterium]MBU1387188.1 histidine kinase [Pseudomonadota bacterium]MBU1541494.1 histidine kinase [Pseudomonadota bacterium]MBU2429594.1 histidine kinase [Pseudomonadota bacterium]MBU2482125.1 histidine kinase [Pseudomonadota bacterium]
MLNDSNDANVYTTKWLLEMIDGLPLAIAVIDGNRNVILANRATLMFVNKNEDQLVGRVGGEAFGCIHHDDVPEGCGFGKDCIKCRLRSSVLETMEKKQSQYMVEITMVFKNQGKRDLRISTQPLILEGQAVVLLAIEDITEVKKNEQIRIQKEKLSAVVQTAGAVCHEMSQPLMVILGLSELLVESIGDDDNRISNIREIKNQAIRLGRMSEKLMNMTHYKTRAYLSDTILDLEADSDDND